MHKRFLLLFMACLAILIGSEYFLLTEVYNGRRPLVLFLSGAGLLSSITVFWITYRRFRRAVATAV
ncbi:hypothetical protein [Flaviaesturariibacter terrae]